MEVGQKDFKSQRTKKSSEIVFSRNDRGFTHGTPKIRPPKEDLKIDNSNRLSITEGGNLTALYLGQRTTGN